MPLKPGGDADELYILGMVLKDARTTAGLTQGEVAEALARSKITVSQWEQGVRAPSVLDLIRLAQLFDTTVSSLLRSFDGFRLPHEHTPPSAREIVSSVRDWATESKASRLAIVRRFRLRGRR